MSGCGNSACSCGSNCQCGSSCNCGKRSMDIEPVMESFECDRENCKCGAGCSCASCS